MFLRTREMISDELKPVLKLRASQERFDPGIRFTIWSENGIWSEGATHILFEGSAATVLDKQRRLREVALKVAGSRLFVLDALRDQVEIVPASELRAEFVR